MLWTLGWLLGDLGAVSAIFLTALLPGLFIPLQPVDLLVARRASDGRLSMALSLLVVVGALWFMASLVLPSGLPFPVPSSDAWEAAIPTLTGLLFAGERMAARGHLAWRDRALGAAAGYAIVGGVFVIGVEWLSWAVLLAALPFRLHRSSRLALGVLSGAAALGLGQYADNAWAARGVEAAAFLCYFAISMVLAQRRPVQPPALPATA